MPYRKVIFRAGEYYHLYNRGNNLQPIFSEHAAEGVEVRAPRDWEELIRWAKIMTNSPPSKPVAKATMGRNTANVSPSKA